MSTAFAAGQPHPDSPGEQLLHQCSQMGLLKGFLFNHNVHGCMVDMFHPKTKVVVEIDGYVPHTRPKQFTTDRQRDRRLQMAGCLVLRFAHSEVFDDPLGTIVAIDEAVRDRLRKR